MKTTAVGGNRMKVTILCIAVALLIMFVITPSQGQKMRGSTTSPKICRALALGGGGDRGAYEAGVLKYLVDNLPAEEVQYDVVAGISAGAINSAGFGQFKIGDEKAGVNFLLSHWLTLSQSDVYKNWPLGIAEGFLIKSGLFSTSPLHNFLTKNINVTALRESGRTILMGASNLNTNTYEQFDQNTVDIVEAVRSSSAVPGVFEAVSMNNQLYVDGGAKYMTPVSDSIAECFSKTNASHVNIDVILAIGDLNFGTSINEATTPFILIRTLFNVIDDIFTKDISNARVAFGSRATIRVFSPTRWLPGYFLGFQYAKQMIQQGYTDAQKVINGN